MIKIPLKVSGLIKDFSGLRAVDGISFEIGENQRRLIVFRDFLRQVMVG